MSQEENKIKVDTYDNEQNQQPKEEIELPVIDDNKGETTESGCCGVRRLIFEAVDTGNGAEIRAVLFFQTACRSAVCRFQEGINICPRVSRLFLPPHCRGK